MSEGGSEEGGSHIEEDEGSEEGSGSDGSEGSGSGSSGEEEEGEEEEGGSGGRSKEKGRSGGAQAASKKVRHPLLDNNFVAFGPPLVSLLLVCRQQLRLLGVGSFINRCVALGGGDTHKCTQSQATHVCPSVRLSVFPQLCRLQLLLL